MSKRVTTWVRPSLALTKPPSFLSPQVGCEEEQLCADFPELDLSQLDASDFDSATCFGELQWCPESSETEPSQYSPEDSELLQVYPLEHATSCSVFPSLQLKAWFCPAPPSPALGHAEKSPPGTCLSYWICT